MKHKITPDSPFLCGDMPDGMYFESEYNLIEKDGVYYVDNGFVYAASLINSILPAPWVYVECDKIDGKRVLFPIVGIFNGWYREGEPLFGFFGIRLVSIYDKTYHNLELDCKPNISKPHSLDKRNFLGGVVYKNERGSVGMMTCDVDCGNIVLRNMRALRTQIEERCFDEISGTNEQAKNVIRIINILTGKKVNMNSDNPLCLVGDEDDYSLLEETFGTTDEECEMLCSMDVALSIASIFDRIDLYNNTKHEIRSVVLDELEKLGFERKMFEL